MRRIFLLTIGTAVTALAVLMLMAVASYYGGWRPAVVDSVPFNDANAIAHRLTKYREANGRLPVDLEVLSRNDDGLKKTLANLERRGVISYRPRVSDGMPQLTFRMRLRQVRGPFTRSLPVEFYWRFPRYLKWRPIGQVQ